MRVYSVKKLLHVSNENRTKRKMNMHTTTIKNNMNSATKKKKERKRDSKKLVI